MDNVGIVVEDLDAAVAFFIELGMELEGTADIEGEFADKAVGLQGVKSTIAVMRTPDGHGKFEMAQYHEPAGIRSEPSTPPANTIGLHRVMFAVDDIDATLADLNGAELVGEVVRYGDSYRLCYLRGPAGIIVELAEAITG